MVVINLLLAKNMKAFLLKALVVYILINIVLGAIFLSGGGMQMLESPKVPPLPSSPSLTSDLDYFQKVVLDNEKDATTAQISGFKNVIREFPAPQTIDDLSVIALAALAQFDNAHTTVLKPKLYRLPVRFHWLGEDLIIVKATTEYASLLGQKVVELGGVSPDKLVPRARKFVGGGTESWLKYRSETLFTSPSILAVLGATVDVEAEEPLDSGEERSQSVALVTATLAGQEMRSSVTASASSMPSDPFWDFRDAFPDNTSFDTEGWLTLLHKGTDLPLYLQKSDQYHLLHSLPSQNAVYLRMNASFADRTETLDELQQRLERMLAEEAPNNLIVDFRYNRGGDYTKVLPIVKAVVAGVPENGRLFLIVGPNTFSAGLISATQFKRYLPSQLTVVGSEVGDKLRFRAEGYYPTLPYSGIQLYLTKAWTDLEKGCGWLDDCWPPNKVLLRKVGSFPIDIKVENTWASYMAGEDKIMDWISANIQHANADR